MKKFVHTLESGNSVTVTVNLQTQTRSGVPILDIGFDPKDKQGTYIEGKLPDDVEELREKTSQALTSRGLVDSYEVNTDWARDHDVHRMESEKWTLPNDIASPRIFEEKAEMAESALKKLGYTPSKAEMIEQAQTPVMEKLKKILAEEIPESRLDGVIKRIASEIPELNSVKSRS